MIANSPRLETHVLGEVEAFMGATHWKPLPSLPE